VVLSSSFNIKRNLILCLQFQIEAEKSALEADLSSQVKKLLSEKNGLQTAVDFYLKFIESQFAQQETEVTSIIISQQCFKILPYSGYSGRINPKPEII